MHAACLAALALVWRGAAGAAPNATYANPLLSGPADHADPGVFYDAPSGMYYAVVTGGSSEAAFRIFTSGDLATWSAAGTLFDNATMPRWGAAGGVFWAPEVRGWNATHYLATYTMRDAATGLMGIGTALSSSPTGPWVDAGAPVVPGDAASGVGYIDSSFFRDPATGTPYLLYKYDGNAKQLASTLYLQEVDNATGGGAVGDPVAVVTMTQPWEQLLIEAPQLHFIAGYYYIFYSAGYNQYYMVGVQRSRSLAGGWEKAPGPMLHTAWGAPSVYVGTPAFNGAGHSSTVPRGDDPSKFVLFYHSWDADAARGNGRMMMMEPLLWVNGWPRVLSESPSQEPMAL